MRFGDVMKEMCDDCPFGNSKAQRHMRNSLAEGRFDEICQSVWQGAFFACHKTTNGEEDDEGEYHYNGKEKQCKGSLEFVERIAEGRREAENRATRSR
jgi:hypothetical protein